MFASTFCKGDYFRTLPLQLVEQRLTVFQEKKMDTSKAPVDFQLCSLECKYTLSDTAV